jgi:fatty acid desaturase
MFTNTARDPHLDGTEPFLRADPAKPRTAFHRATACLFPFLISFGIFANYASHACAVARGDKGARPEKLVFFVQVAALVASHGARGALYAYIVFGTTSVWYFTLALMNHNTAASVDVSRREAARDWGERQLASCSDFGTGASFLGSAPYLWLNYHTVHHLFPSVDMSRHPDIQPILVQTAREHGICYSAVTVRAALSQMLRHFGL